MSRHESSFLGEYLACQVKYHHLSYIGASRAFVRNSKSKNKFTCAIRHYAIEGVHSVFDSDSCSLTLLFFVSLEMNR